MNSVTVARTAPMMIPPTQISGDESDPETPWDLKSTDKVELGIRPVFKRLQFLITNGRASLLVHLENFCLYYLCTLPL